jgi:hypothetical protein
VPGGSRESPLRRLADEAKAKDNRNEANKVCRDVWGKDYAKGGPECDEFPFGGYQRSSVRPIPRADNNDGGGIRLQNFYWSNRVLDGDQFTVRILP